MRDGGGGSQLETPGSVPSVQSVSHLTTANTTDTTVSTQLEKYLQKHLQLKQHVFDTIPSQNLRDTS